MIMVSSKCLVRHSLENVVEPKADHEHAAGHGDAADDERGFLFFAGQAAQDHFAGKTQPFPQRGQMVIQPDVFALLGRLWPHSVGRGDAQHSAAAVDAGQDSRAGRCEERQPHFAGIETDGIGGHVEIEQVKLGHSARQAQADDIAQDAAQKARGQGIEHIMPHDLPFAVAHGLEHADGGAVAFDGAAQDSDQHHSSEKQKDEGQTAADFLQAVDLLTDHAVAELFGPTGHADEGQLALFLEAVDESVRLLWFGQRRKISLTAPTCPEICWR